jgi:hypothetical protein
VKRLAGTDRRIERRHRFGSGLAGSDQFLGFAATRLLKGEAAQTGEAFVHPLDRTEGVGQHDRIGGAAGHEREAAAFGFGPAVVFRHLLGESHRPGARTAQPPGKGRRQPRHQQSAPEDQVRQEGAAATLKGGQGTHADGPLLAEHCEDSRRGKSPRGGRTRQERVLVVIKQQVLRIHRLTLIHFKVNLVAHQRTDSSEQSIDPDGGVNPAHEIGLAGLHGIGFAEGPVDGAKEQKAGHSIIAVDQLDLLRKFEGAVAHRRLGRGPAGFPAGDVETERKGIEFQGRNVADHITDAVLPARLHLEAWVSRGSHAPLEGGELGARHALDVTQSNRAFVEVTFLQADLSRPLFRGRRKLGIEDERSEAHHRLFRRAKPRVDVLQQPVLQAVKPGLVDALDLLPHEMRAHKRQRHQHRPHQGGKEEVAGREGMKGPAGKRHKSQFERKW